MWPAIAVLSQLYKVNLNLKRQIREYNYLKVKFNVSKKAAFALFNGGKNFDLSYFTSFEQNSPSTSVWLPFRKTENQSYRWCTMSPTINE